MLLALSGPGWADTVQPPTFVADAGSLLQQRQAPPPPVKAPSKATSLQTPPQTLSLAANAVVEVTRFEVAGNSLVSTTRLLEALVGYQGRRLGFNELQRVAAAIGEAYAEAGLLARAYLPPQDITSGVIRLQIEEAQFGTVRIQGMASRFNAQRASSYIAAQQASADPVRVRNLERALILLSELPGVKTQASLAAGQTAGQTDLVLNLSDTPLLTGEAALDNHGSRSTGATSVSLGASVNSLLGVGDSLVGTFSTSQGNQYAKLGVNLPLGVAGWRLGGAVSKLRYKLIAAEFAALGSEGQSEALGVDLSYPLLRGRRANAQIQLGAERKRFDNQANGSTTSHYSSRALTLALSGNFFDAAGGGGANTASVLLSRGEVDLEGSPNFAADAATTATHGSFTKLRYRLSRTQPISPEWSAYAALSGQSSGHKNLDSSEKFYLGGPQGVRAYPASEAGGSSGQLANFELRAQLPFGIRGALFYDWGQVRVNLSSSFVGAPQPNDITLKGAGVGLAWLGPAGIDFRLTVATRIGSNPAADSQGRDQDGSLNRTRIWLQSTAPF